MSTGTPIWITEVDGGVELEVLAVPRASRSRVVGIHDDRVKVQLAAPPADGEANAALLELFVKGLGVKRTAVSLISGHGNRRKRLGITGVSVPEVRAFIEK